MNKLSASLFYLSGESALAFIGSMAWVLMSAYYVLTVHMNPLQLLLVGTAFELTIVLCEIPTGVLADVYSRRLCIIAGSLLTGCALVLQGLVPLFALIVLAQVVDGLGDTFVSGAWSAWLMDEVGEERFGPLLTRGSQLRQIGSVAGTIGGALLATIQLQLPIVLAGVLCFAFTLFAAAAMPEQGFRPAHHPGHSRWHAMTGTLRKSLRIVRASGLMIAILGIAAFFGMFSEAIDRLGDAHFLLDVRLPPFAGLKSIVWFGVIGAGGLLLSAMAMELPRRRLNLQSHRSVTRALLAVNASIVAAVLAFALAPNFAMALCAYWAWGTLRPIVDLLSTVWLNQNIPDPAVRATVLSMSGQANALGESMGGPVIGLVGTVFSIRAALSMGALLLSPALGLYGWALRRGGTEPLVAAEDASGAERMLE